MERVRIIVTQWDPIRFYMVA